MYGNIDSTVSVFHSNLGQGAPATGPIVIYVRVLRVGLCRSSVAVTEQLLKNNDDLREKYYSVNVSSLIRDPEARFVSALFFAASKNCSNVTSFSTSIVIYFNERYSFTTYL